MWVIERTEELAHWVKSLDSDAFEAGQPLFFMLFSALCNAKGMHIKMEKNKDFINELESTLSKKRIENARKEAEKEILQIRLAQIRKKFGIRQEDIKSFSQSGVSKLESRKDLKISTLINYLENLGLGIEIKAYPKDKKIKKEEIILLRI
jgi:hypothetical protein